VGDLAQYCESVSESCWMKRTTEAEEFDGFIYLILRFVDSSFIHSVDGLEVHVQRLFLTEL